MRYVLKSMGVEFSSKENAPGYDGRNWIADSGGRC